MTRRVRGRILAFVAGALFAPVAAGAAGNIEASVKGGNLVITGDDEGNYLTIDQAGLIPGELRITPGVSTTLNGAAAAAVFSGVTKGASSRRWPAGTTHCSATR